MNRFLKGIDPAVFWGSAVLISGFVGWGLFAPASLGTVMSTSLSWVIANFGWGFVLIAFGGLALCVFLVIHPWGNIRLGPDDSRPDFGTFSWVSMMPDGIDKSQISAEFDDGLVEITVRNGVSCSDSTRIALADKSEGATTRSVD